MGHDNKTDELQPDQLIAELRRHNLLPTLMQRRVVGEAVAGEQVAEEELEQAREAYFRKNGIEDDVALQRFLLNQGLSYNDLIWNISLPLRIRAHCSKHFRHKAEAHFLSRKNQLDKVVYSLLRVKDLFLARELYLRIEAGEASFADLAAEYAEGPEKQTNGIVGPVPLTQAHPALAERLRTNTPGVLNPPFRLSEWWLVMRLESYTPASFDDATALRMAEELFNQWVNEETTRKMAALRSSGAVSPAV